MNRSRIHLLNLLVVSCILCGCLSVVNAQRPKLIVTTDIGQDPDDQQSMVRLLHYANEFDLLGLIANADANYEHETALVKDEVLHTLIKAYGTLLPNFRMHDERFPSETYLHGIVKRGCSGNGREIPVEKYIGNGKDTEGSNWIIEQVDKSMTRVNISVWGGACDLAQALYDVKKNRTAQELEAFVEKLRVYFIGKQDSSNQWIMQNFPKLWLVLGLSRDGDSWASSYRGMFLGGDMKLTSRDWLHSNVIGQNVLGELYPDETYTKGGTGNPFGAMKEGDSPAFLFFLPNGLNVPEHPEYGGWGGRFTSQRDNFYRDASDTCFDASINAPSTSAKATVFRWRPDFQNDFAARVQWGVKSYGQANHAPKVVVNDVANHNPLHIKARNGQVVAFDASKSSDPDKDRLSFEWKVYAEAGSFQAASDSLLSVRDKSKTEVRVPKEGAGTLHIILSLQDDNKNPMVSYRRVILEIDE